MNKKISDFLNVLNEITPESLNPNKKDTTCPVFVFDPINSSSNDDPAYIAVHGTAMPGDGNLYGLITNNLTEVSKNFNKENISGENSWVYSSIKRCIMECKRSISSQVDLILDNYKPVYIYNFINLCSTNLGINIAADSQLYNIIMTKVVSIIKNNNCISDTEYVLSNIDGDFRIDDIDWIAFVNSVVMNFECYMYNLLSEIGGLILISSQNKTTGNGNVEGVFVINDIINTIIYENHGSLIYTIDTNLQIVIKEITKLVNNPYLYK